MVEQSFIDSLKVIRESARKQHRSYLQEHNFLDKIEDLVPYHDFKIREKIDVILDGMSRKCEQCDRYAKVSSRWCCSKCKDKDPTLKLIVGQVNRDNAITRNAKRKATMLERYGVEEVRQMPGMAKKIRASTDHFYESMKTDTFIKYGLDIVQLSNHEHLKQICKNSSYLDLSETHFKDVPLMTIYRHFERINFDPCFEKTRSGAEIQVAEYVKSLGFAIDVSNRKIIAPLELDIVIETKKIAIEYHGSYFHKNEKTKHLNKYIRGQQAGYQVIQIFDFEWKHKQEIVKSIIASKLGATSRVFARKCTLSVVDSRTALDFLEKTHIQGKVGGAHIGLYHDAELVALMTVGKNRFKEGYELYRFSCKLNTTVVGGFSKLLEYVKTNITDTMTTYADMRYSNGSVYQKFGTYLHTSEPGYVWISSDLKHKYSRYQTQKAKLAKLLGDKFNANETEVENMNRLGFFQLWDCGNLVYQL